MMQIDTSTQKDQTQHINVDAEKLYLQERVQEFLNQEEIVKRIRSIIGRGSRFNVNLDEIRGQNPQLANYIMRQPIEAIKMFEDALNSQIRSLQEDGGKLGSGSKQQMNTSDANFPKKILSYHVNFEGNFAQNFVTPRGLRANLLNQLVTVQGIVTRMSLVQPKIQTSVHYCESTKRGHVKNYTDKTNISSLAEGQQHTDGTNAFPTKDMNDNPLSTEYGYCIYKDSQVLTIQEMPERAPPGQLPRSIQVVLENDLVDRVKPGDRVEVTGIFKAEDANQNNSSFHTRLIATGIQNIALEKEKPVMSEQDIRNIRKISKDEKVFDLLGASIGGSIEGHLAVKKALLLLLLGGAEKNLENGTHLRGDINIMMVGDPSTAKSQLLRHIIDIAPLAINTTGRGSTGVGLTAAVTSDKDTGEKHLEAGAMVLADRGIVCIDEFDKMNDIDRVAIHEVMEQQTVTIAKAGLHVSLNARCSVIAAANPIYGDYARDESVGRNIGLPDSLLSRFDLLFVMLDEKDAELDRKIAERVINNHRYRSAKHDTSLSHFNYNNDDVIVEKDLINDAVRNQDERGTIVFEKNFNQLMAASTQQSAGRSTRRGGSKSGANEVKTEDGPIVEGTTVTREFLKKYISFAKSQKAPEISSDCIEYAAQYYSVLRTKAKEYDAKKVSVPITVRTLETMLRLATAHAKLKLSKNVEPTDIDIAVTLLNACIFQEQPNNVKDEYSEDEDEEMVDEQEEIIKVHATKSRSERMAEKEAKSPNTKRQVKDEDSDEEIKVTSRRNRNMQKSANIEKEQPSKKAQQKSSQDNQTPKKKSFSEKKSLQNSDESNKSNKKMKVDHEEQVSQLFQGQPAKVSFSISQKKFVFKLVNDVKDKQNKTTIDQIWKKYFTMPEKQTMQPNSTEPMLSQKSQLLEIVTELEKENLVMFTPEDGTVILI